MPDSGLDPRTVRSLPEPKADTQPLSHPGAPVLTEGFHSTLSISLMKILKDLAQVFLGVSSPFATVQ